MIWYEDENLAIYFKTNPTNIIHERHILPSMTKEDKDDVSKFPIISTTDLEVKITTYSFKGCEHYKFIIPKGTKSDGASIPRIFWSALGITPTDPRVIEGAFVHDWLCKNHSDIGNNRYLATRIFERMIAVSGVGSFRRWLMFHSVDNFQKLQKWSKDE